MDERQWKKGAVKRLADVYEDIALARDRNTEMLTDVSRALRDGVHALNPAARRHSSNSTWSSRQSSLSSQPANATRTERSAAPSPSPAEDMSSSRTRMPVSSSVSYRASVADDSSENDCRDPIKQANTLDSNLERTYTLPPLIPLSPLKPVTLEESESSSMPLIITTSMNNAQSMPPTPPDTPTKRKLGTHFAHHNLPGLATAPFAFPIMTELSMPDLDMPGMFLPEMDTRQTDAVTESRTVKQSRSRISPKKRPFSPSPPLPSVLDVNDEVAESAKVIEEGVGRAQEEGGVAEGMGAEVEAELRITKRRSPSPKKTVTFERPSSLQSQVKNESAAKPEPEQAEKSVTNKPSKASLSKQPAVPIITLRDFDDLGSSSREVSLGSTVSAASTNPSSVDHSDITSDPSKRASCPTDKLDGSAQNEQDPEVEAWLSPLREAALDALEEDTATLVDALRSFVNGLKELGSDLAALRSAAPNEQSPRKRRSTDSNIRAFNPATPYKMSSDAPDPFRAQTNTAAKAQALCVKARKQLWDMKALISALKTPRQEALLLSQAGPGSGSPDWARLGMAQKVGFLLERLRMNDCDAAGDCIVEATSVENIPAVEKILVAVVEEAANVEFLGKVRGWEEGVERLEGEFGGLFA